MVKDQLLLAAECGVDVVSSTEELLVPEFQHAKLAKQLDASAKAGGDPGVVHGDGALDLLHGGGKSGQATASRRGRDRHGIRCDGSTAMRSHAMAATMLRPQTHACLR